MSDPPRVSGVRHLGAGIGGREVHRLEGQRVLLAYRKDQADHDAWMKSDFSTATNRVFFTGRVATVDAADRAAADMALPASIRTGIHAYALSYANLQLPILEKCGFDWARALNEGTPDERHLITNSGPDVRDQAAMDSAYNDQVCAE